LTLFNIVAVPELFIDNPKYQIDSFENGFLSVVETNQIIYKETELADKRVVWYNQTETDNNGKYLGGLYETIGYTTFSYGYNFPEYDLNNLTKICSDSEKPICENTKLIILSTDPSIFLKVQKNFQMKNQSVLLLKNENVKNGKVNFNITIVKFLQNNNIWVGDSNKSQMTSDSLKRIIASEYPQINNQNITDWERVNILRDWAYEHTDYSGDAFNLDSNSSFNYYQKQAPQLYAAFLNDQGGVACSGDAYALQQLYEMYGFKSDVVSVGDPIIGNHTSHAVTLVKIYQNNKSLLTIQDSYFGLTLMDNQKNPLDFFELIELLNEERYSDVVIKFGTQRLKDMILLNTDIPLVKKGWANVEENTTVQLSDNIVKIKVQMSLEKFENISRNYYNESQIKSPFFNITYPYLMLYKNPYSIIRNQNPDLQLMKTVESITDGTCLYEPLTESSLNQFIPIINLTFGNDFEDKFEINCTLGNCYKKTETGDIIYTPGSDSDHIASNFFSLPVNLINEQIFVTSVTYDAQENLSRIPEIHIQNSDYNIISDDLNDYIFLNTSNGNLFYINEFYLPPGNKSFRILIQSPSNQETLLPQEIYLYSKKP
jgi:hypothetical protein